MEVSSIQITYVRFCSPARQVVSDGVDVNIVSNSDIEA